MEPNSEVPDKDGFYWWRRNERTKWGPVCLVNGFVYFNGREGEFHASDVAGQWGSRIPNPNRNRKTKIEV